MNNPIEDLVKYIIGLAIVIIGYFLKDIMAKFKKLEETTTKDKESILLLKSRVHQLEENHESGFIQLEKLFEEKFKRFEEKFTHMEGTLKNFNEYIKLLTEEIKKK